VSEEERIEENPRAEKEEVAWGGKLYSEGYHIG
jgi:hypothetical protein